MCCWDFLSRKTRVSTIKVRVPTDRTITKDLFISAFTYLSNFDEERLNSYFGRVTYNFKEKYMLEATLRRDGSSVFGENVRWATFPSVALGWAFSEEPFMTEIPPTLLSSRTVVARPLHFSRQCGYVAEYECRRYQQKPELGRNQPIRRRIGYQFVRLSL